MTTADPFDTPLQDDPFDTPAYDPATGELLGEEPVEQPAEELPVPFALGAHAAEAIAYASRSEASMREFTADLRGALEERINATYSELVAARSDGPLQDAVAPELTWLANAHETMDSMGRVFTDQARGLRSLAGDVVLEVRADKPVERTGGSASVKVGTGGNAAVKVTATQPTEVFTDTPGIVDVLVPYLLGEVLADAEPGHAEPYAAGARAMAAVLLGLDGRDGVLASPKWKSTSLDALRQALQGAENGVALAARLDAAYGRRPKGNVTTTIERTELRAVRKV